MPPASNPIADFIGGILFLGIAVYFLVYPGYKKAAAYAADGYARWGKWQLRSRWYHVVTAVTLLALGLYLVWDGARRWRDPEGVYQLIGGAIFILVTVRWLLQIRRLARTTAVVHRWYGSQIRRHPWILWPVGLLAGAAGAYLIARAIFAF